MGDSTDSETEALFAMVRARYAGRLTGEQLAELRDQVASLVERARALRAVRLQNSDEPAQPFAPFRGDGA